MGEGEGYFNKKASLTKTYIRSENDSIFVSLSLPPLLSIPHSSLPPLHLSIIPLSPEYLRDDLATALDEGGFKNVMLDHEYGAAKDDNQKHPVRTFELYTTERHPSKKEFEYPAQEELGGAWFQGLAESVAQQRATVQVRLYH